MTTRDDDGARAPVECDGTSATRPRSAWCSVRSLAHWHYRGCTIVREYESEWSWQSDEYTGTLEDARHGVAPSLGACVEEIDEMILDEALERL